ncbi:hypothetical protein B0G38_002355 [Arthrobacter sp. VKM Ac-2550]|nr:hypothetical protein [Arthrobacter sp. VKM Ac-2550]
MAFQAPSCASVGALKAPANHALVAGENLERTGELFSIVRDYRPPPTGRTTGGYAATKVPTVMSTTASLAHPMVSCGAVSQAVSFGG